jgi:hypothetical protein
LEEEEERERLPRRPLLRVRGRGPLLLRLLRRLPVPVRLAGRGWPAADPLRLRCVCETGAGGGAAAAAAADAADRAPERPERPDDDDDDAAVAAVAAAAAGLFLRQPFPTTQWQLASAMQASLRRPEHPMLGVGEVGPVGDWDTFIAEKDGDNGAMLRQ